MSWWIEAIGSPVAVKALVAKEQHMPQPVKDCINAVCDAAVPGEDVHIETNGHFGAGGSQHKTWAKCVRRLPEPGPEATAEPAAAPEAVQPAGGPV